MAEAPPAPDADAAPEAEADPLPVFSDPDPFVELPPVSFAEPASAVLEAFPPDPLPLAEPLPSPPELAPPVDLADPAPWAPVAFADPPSALAPVPLADPDSLESLRRYGPCMARGTKLGFAPVPLGLAAPNPVALAAPTAVPLPETP